MTLERTDGVTDIAPVKGYLFTDLVLGTVILSSQFATHR